MEDIQESQESQHDDEQDLIILKYSILRCERNKLLKNTDKYMISDFPHSSESKKNEWITYRQLLRNLPSTQTPELDNFGDLINITWPTKPE